MKNPNADRDMLLEMRDILDQECKKPPKKRDYDLIQQLTTVLLEATSTVDLEDIKKKSVAELRKSSSKRTQYIQKRQWLHYAIPVLVCVVLVASLNAWTLYVWGINLYQAVYHVSDGGIFIYPSELDSKSGIELESSIDDPYGIRKECEKLGFSPLIPSYIPDTMKLNSISRNEGDVTNLSLNYKQDNKTYLGIRYTYIPDTETYNNFQYGFPSNDHHVHAESFDDKTVIISWEDQVFHAVFCADHVVYGVHGRKMDYNTVYRVLLSFFE